jgi:hypothetical protein
MSNTATATTDALAPGQFVLYRGTNGVNGEYVVTHAERIDGEIRYRVRSIPARLHKGSLVKGPRYRHREGETAIPLVLNMVSRKSLCPVWGMTVDTIEEVEI